MTLIEMLEKSSHLFPDKTAIIYNDEQMSYRELSRQSELLADFFAEHGLAKGDRVGLIVKKNPAAIVSSLGTAMAGGIFYTIDYNQPDEKIQYIIDLTRPAFLIVSAEFKELLVKLKFNNMAAKIIIIGDNDNTDYFSWEEALCFNLVARRQTKIDQHDPVYLNFTSGSTGKPKGAVTTHDNLYWNTKAVVESFKFNHEDVHLCGFPIFTHPHELFCRAFYTGGTIVLTENFLPQSITSSISQHKVTCLMAIPIIYESLIRYLASPSPLKTLRVAESAGMHVSSSLVNSFKERFNINITAAWGSTETTGVALANPTGKTKPDSIGKPCPYYEIKVVDETNHHVGTDEIGEMAIRGPANCSRYFSSELENSELMEDGWLYTGDMVKKDPEGYFYFISRKSRMIKVAGLKVYPSEIEEILAKHPDVEESAVARIKDQILGEAPRAVVVLKPNARVTATELRRYCSERMANYKVPAVVEIVSELPKSQSGKILYKEL